MSTHMPLGFSNIILEPLSLKKAHDLAFPIRLVYAICLAGATYNHARIVATHGLDWNYGGLPAPVCVFWTALTFIDPLAAILMMTVPRPGLALTVAIIVSDVVVNAWVGATYGFDVAAFSAQALFLMFVLSTVRVAWRGESQAPSGSPARLR